MTTVDNASAPGRARDASIQPALASAIYTGTLRHRRYAEVTREFSFPVDFIYLDLAELPTIARGRLMRPTPGPWRFRRRDFHGPSDRSLADAVRDTVARQTGEAPTGPVRMLTQLRCFGMAFNPVTLYYCFAPDGESLHAVLAEVTNTPWRERHAYALGPWHGQARVLSTTINKQLHVSPFMPMDQTYELRLTPPAQTLSVHIDLQRENASDFDATLGLRRHELSDHSLAQLIRQDPVAPLRTLRRIYAQGVAIKRAGVPVQPHPTRGHA